MSFVTRTLGRKRKSSANERWGTFRKHEAFKSHESYVEKSGLTQPASLIIKHHEVSVITGW